MWSIGASFFGWRHGAEEPPKALVRVGVSTQCEAFWPSPPSLKSPPMTVGVPVAARSSRVSSWRRSASARWPEALPWVLAGLWMLQTQIACPVVVEVSCTSGMPTSWPPK